MGQSHLICSSRATGHIEFIREEAASPGQVPGTEMHPGFYSQGKSCADHTGRCRGFPTCSHPRGCEMVTGAGS